MVDVASTTTFTGKALDLDMTDFTLPQGIDVSWSCLDFINNSTCINSYNETIPFNSTSLSQNVTKYQFKGYWMYKIFLIG